LRESNEAIRLYVRKLEVISDLKSTLDRESIRRASKDPHSFRMPRPCGMTVHPGIGCIHGCIYCYLPDMGINNLSVEPYRLSGDELAYALAINPYVVPERTLAAFGSITEPLLPQVVDKTLEYLRSIGKWLNLPSQLSTKVVINDELASNLKLLEPDLSVLVTVVTIKYHKLIEPRAPNPLSRFEGMLVASKHGLRTDLFLRPIIPGVTNYELSDLLKLAKEHGAKGVITGSLRVTRRIVEELRRAGLLNDELRKLLPRRLTNKQVSVSTSYIKELVKKLSEYLGLEFMRSACSANIKAHNMHCNLCRFGPCGSDSVLSMDGVISEASEFLEYLGFRVINVASAGNAVLVSVRGNVRNLMINPPYFLSEVFKVKFKIKYL